MHHAEFLSEIAHHEENFYPITRHVNKWYQQHIRGGSRIFERGVADTNRPPNYAFIRFKLSEGTLPYSYSP